MSDSDDGTWREKPHESRAETPRKKSAFDIEDRSRGKLNAVFENPLAGIPRDQLMKDVEVFCTNHGLNDYLGAFKNGALAAQNPSAATTLPELSEADRNALEREHTHKWSQPFTLYWLAVMCSLAAAVQGMDETVNNGAQALYLKARQTSYE